MLLKKYNQFLDTFRVDENVQQAKNFLRNRELEEKRKKVKDPEEAKKITLTPEEVNKAERNPDFLKIKEMLNDNPGYVYAFTKFHFDQDASFESLKEMYKKIQEYRSLISQLPMPVERYADIKGDAQDGRNGFERLFDDLEKLSRYRIAKKFVDKLYGNIRREYQSAAPVIKEKIENIAVAFDELGKESNGTKDLKKNQELQDLFFSKVKRYKTLNEVINAAQSFLKAASNDNISKFMQSIQKTNLKFGEMNGVEIVYDENKILILEIKSFQASKELCSNTSWCIASSQHYWNSYVGSDENYNKQYAVYNFNLPPNDDKSIIGVTIGPNQQIKACHTKSDASFSGQIKDYMKKINVPFAVLASMTEEEIEKKKRRVKANKEIIKDNLSLEDVKRYVEDGADPNANEGKALKNAVAEDNYAKAEYLLSIGASPNIGSPIQEVKNLKMLKLLVDHGAEMVNEIFTKFIINDYDAVEYVLKRGLDPGYQKGLPLRMAAKLNRIDVMELLIKYGAQIDDRRLMVLKWACEFGQTEAVLFVKNKMEELYKTDKQFKERMDNFSDKRIGNPIGPDGKITDKLISELIEWADSSDKIERPEIDKTIKFLKNLKKM